jgi:glutamate-5-semialdehyde dehydrogenase
MIVQEMVREQAQKAKQAEVDLALLSDQVKNKILFAMADALINEQGRILAANALDMKAGREKGMRGSFLDRLLLTDVRLESIAEGLRKVAQLPNPVGQIVDGRTLPNGLTITKIKVPLGVIGIIYEARPNVTADAIGLCIKSGNAVILKGGSEAINSNKVISDVLAVAGEHAGMPKGAIQFINMVERTAVDALITLNGLVDVIIPRGSVGLIQMVVTNSTVPVIETGAGVCHTYIDAFANVEMAVNIAFNAKVSRPSTCNAMETLLVHKAIADKFMPVMIAQYNKAGVSVIGDAAAQEYGNNIAAATESAWGTEYGDLRVNVKIVDSLEQAIEHIRKYGTGHSEAIVTENYANARRFQDAIDAAAVYVNASTRFTDGFEFGFGAEIGISTQKLHARGPMGLPELTTFKYLINGNGQIRE